MVFLLNTLNYDKFSIVKLDGHNLTVTEGKQKLFQFGSSNLTNFFKSVFDRLSLFCP